MIADFVLLAIFAACVAMMWTQGAWGNILALINVLFAAMVATNYFEPLAGWLEKFLPTYTYLLDFLALWLLFALTAGTFKLMTDFVSRERVRFKMPVEIGTRIIAAIWAAWVIVSFTAMSLHTAPLPVNSFVNSFDKPPKQYLFFGLAPDRQWLGFMQSRSQGALAAGGTTDSPFPEDQGKRVFDPLGEFVVKYRTRRLNLEAEQEFRVIRSATP
jgi:hypothetical protein